jgi:hypothetical protein
MPSKAKPVTIGPFAGGLNNVSLAGEARDSEVVDLVNLDVTIDNALTSRPPIEALAGSTLPSTNTIGWEVLGIYRVSLTEWYLIVTAPNDGSTNTDTTLKAYLNGVVGTGESITIIKQSVGIANRVTSMVQFNDYLFFNVEATATDTGFKWKKGDAAGGTAIATMPRGSIMITWKTRIWIAGTGTSVNGARVWFSAIDGTGPHPETYNAQDFFDVAPGEGGFITAMISSFNNMIIFKNSGTWRYSFPADPSKGSVDRISGNVGCAGRWAVVDFENYIYVYAQGRVYELVNSNYTQINRFVKFATDPYSVDSVATGVEMSIVNRRLVVRYFNTIYTFSIDSKGWSQWRSYSGTPGRFVELPADASSSNPSQFIAASRGTTQAGSANLLSDPTFADPVIRAARAAVLNGTVTYSGTSASISATGVCSMLLNSTGSTTDFDIPVATSQQFNFSVNVTAITGTAYVDITYLLASGATSILSSTAITTTGSKSFNFTTPAGAILAIVSIRFAATGSITYTLPSWTRTTATSPFNLMRITDQYPSQTAAVEFIDCYFQTKSYDYKAPGNFKRLYWAGMDVKSSRKIKTETRPVSRVVPVTWDQLGGYTHDQLAQGSWGSPLSWLGTSLAELELLPEDLLPSENGRYFKKFAHSMRFRQVSYIIRMTSLGNLATGPVKFFTITTYVDNKEHVVDAST